MESVNKLSVDDLQLQGKVVLMRVDFNVPLEGGKVSDTKRIRAALPTIRRIVEQKARLILMSHLGRPKGQRVPEMSLAPCVPVLNELMGSPVHFADDCIGTGVEAAAAGLAEGEVLLLENLRYHRQETENDREFAAALAKPADVYVNDAFGTAHRAHASTEGVTHFFEQCAAGFLMQKEIDYLQRVTRNPQKPFAAILGGAKISGKIEVIENLLPKVDAIIIGGGMAYTFFKARGWEIGGSLLEEDKIGLAADLLDKGGDKLVLPVDCMVSDQFDFAARRVGTLAAVKTNAIPAGAIALDIGPGSIEKFAEVLAGAKTIVWNGPMGVFEIEATSRGTFAMAGMLADLTDKGTVTVVGGGDSALAAARAGVEEKLSHISTGGGASLEFLEGKTLPGIAALTDKL